MRYQKYSTLTKKMTSAPASSKFKLIGMTKDNLVVTNNMC